MTNTASPQYRTDANNGSHDPLALPAFLVAEPGVPRPIMSDKHMEAVLQLTPEQASRIHTRLRLRNPDFPGFEDVDPVTGKHPTAKGLLLAALRAGNGQRDLVLAIMRDNDPVANQAAETLIGKPITRPAPKAASTARLKNAREAKPTKLRYDPSWIVTVLVPTNPKRPGGDPHRRFALYAPGMTAAEAVAAGVLPADIVWDRDHGFIKLEPAS